jgi:flagellar protein FliO/FliZ
MKGAGIYHLVAWLSFAGPVYADATRSITAGAGSPDLGVAALQTVGALLLVIAVAALALWMMKRLALRPHAAGAVVKVIAGAAVGQRERVVVVEVSDIWLILGVAPGEVKILHTMAKPHDTADSVNQATGRRAEFQNWLHQMIVNTRGGQ